jgi:riboflavin synthase
MFTGIVECRGKVEELIFDRSNLMITISSPVSNELKVDQSVAHDGVCLTVTEVNADRHKVVAIKETLSKTNLDEWKVGSLVNLERCVLMNGRLDGHLVQGHVDTTAICTGIESMDGSWKFWFTHAEDEKNITVEKGSITVNGTSLTVVDSSDTKFSVCIIPYTYENTNFNALAIGNKVNIEFDIIGKYVAKLMSKR